MQAGYFATAWADIKGTPGWLGKILLLALVALIPVFGPLVAGGYLYGWARDIAWGLQGPMPKRIFGNEDGRLYSRGLFILVIGFVFFVVSWGLGIGWELIAVFSALTFGAGHSGWPFGGLTFLSGILGMVFGLLTLAAVCIVLAFQMTGNMRMSIYGRLSAGFQISKSWAMIRHDPGGLMRILGMMLIFGVGIGFAVSVLVAVVALFLALAIIVMAGGSIQMVHVDGGFMELMAVFGGLVLLPLLGLALVWYFAAVAMMFVSTLVTRALGYWVRQFDVPQWRGQDDPLPFELAAFAQRPQGGPRQPPAGT